MGILDKIGEAVTTVAWEASMARELWQDDKDFKGYLKDKYYYLKERGEYVAGNVIELEEKVAEENILFFARIYSLAYIKHKDAPDVSIYSSYLGKIIEKAETSNEMKTVMCNFRSPDGEDDSFYTFEKAQKYIDKLTSIAEYEMILDDVESLIHDITHNQQKVCKGEAASRIRTYLKRKINLLTGEDDGNESLSKMLDDLI